MKNRRYMCSTHFHSMAQYLDLEGASGRSVVNLPAQIRVTFTARSTFEIQQVAQDRSIQKMQQFVQ